MSKGDEKDKMTAMHQWHGLKYTAPLILKQGREQKQLQEQKIHEMKR